VLWVLGVVTGCRDDDRLVVWTLITLRERMMCIIGGGKMVLSQLDLLHGEGLTMWVRLIWLTFITPH